MFANRYEWLIGLRYLRAKRTQHFISVITFLSMGGIALGVAALIVVLAVMTGFRETLQQQILGVTSHVTIRSYTGEMSQFATVLEIASHTPGVSGAAPFIAGQAMAQAKGRPIGITLRGIDSQREKRFLTWKKIWSLENWNNCLALVLFWAKVLPEIWGLFWGSQSPSWWPPPT